MKIQFPEKTGEVIFKPSRQTTIYAWICQAMQWPVEIMEELKKANPTEDGIAHEDSDA